MVMIDKLKSLPTDTSEQLIGTFISVIDNLGVLAGGGKKCLICKMTSSQQ